MALWDEESMAKMALRPWQVRLINKIARAPKDSHIVILMPRTFGHPWGSSR